MAGASLERAPKATRKGLRAAFARLRALELEPGPAGSVCALGGRIDGMGPWRVLLLGEGRVLAALDPAAARRLARDLNDSADFLEAAHGQR